jgi:DivIVA domain-containing protein
MDVDKSFIEGRSFSTSRKGYDPAEVDAHLKEVSRRVEEARREQSSPQLAAGAAEQVRVILEAAERSAAEIQDKAEQQARRSKEEAERSAEEARDRVLKSADELEAEVGKLLGQLRAEADSITQALREGAGRIDAALGEMRTDLPGPQAAGAEERAEPGPPDAEPEVVEAVEETVEAKPAPPAAAEGGNGSAARKPASKPSAGAEGARLVALNMALNGSSREETASYLSENFEIEDQDSLLEDVYQQVGGAA